MVASLFNNLIKITVVDGRKPAPSHGVFRVNYIIPIKPCIKNPSKHTLKKKRGCMQMPQKPNKPHKSNNPKNELAEAITAADEMKAKNPPNVTIPPEREMSPPQLG